MRTVLSVLLFTTVFISCNNQSRESTLSSADTASNAVQQAASAATDTTKLPAMDELTMGVCKLKGGAQGTVRLYDENENLTDSIVLSDEHEPTLHPWANKTDYGILVFRVIGQQNNYYKVIADEDKQRTAFLKKADPAMEFQTWDQHILKTFSVEFDEQQNPARKKPDAQSAVISIKDEGDIVFHPIAVQGEWMQVEWGDGSPANTGWIRWKNGNKRLIEFYYLS